MASSLSWLAQHPLQPPQDTIMVDSQRRQPARKEPLTSLTASLSTSSGAEIAPHMAGLRTDEELSDFLQKTRGKAALVEFGSSWCTKCHEVFPTFYALSKKYDGFSYAVAQVDYMKEATKDLKYSPTFMFYSRDGRRVDSVLGVNAQRLEDHLWLHSDSD